MTDDIIIYYGYNNNFWGSSFCDIYGLERDLSVTLILGSRLFFFYHFFFPSFPILRDVEGLAFTHANACFNVNAAGLNAFPRNL